MPTLTKEIIEAAIAGFEGQKQRIDSQISELRAMLDGSVAPMQKRQTRGKRKFSPEALERMRDAQRRRWAKVRRGTQTASAPAPQTPKRKLSAAGRKAIVDALKKRWAAKKAVARQSARAAKKTKWKAA